LFNYARHFGLLALLGAGLAIARPRAGLGIGAQFALYGALHAAALVLSIRPGAACAPARRILFVALAAALALCNARLGLFGLHAAGEVVGPLGPLAVVAACAASGALAYAALISASLVRIDLSSLAAISLGCAAVTACSFAIARAVLGAGVLWLVIPWWFAFSALLRYTECRKVA
jgi:hypothetical protein